MNILQVGTTDTLAGAEKVAWNLFRSYRSRGHGSWLAVGRKLSDDLDVLLIPNHELRKSWSRFWLVLNTYLESFCGRVRGASRLSDLLCGLAEPARWLDQHRGIEDFHFPGTWDLLRISPQAPDILHLHNLHGGYFDLRVLPWLSQQLPLILTLHDAWLLSGHCAHSLDCERWKTGCGNCPYLTVYPAIQRDATSYNWQRKREIYAKSRFYLSTPCRWLMEKVEHSILASAIREARIIPNGVDLTVFHSSEKPAARATLTLPQNAKVLLFTAYAIRRNVWKDYNTVRTAISLVGKHLHGQNILLVALGEDAPAERIGQAEVRFVPYQKDPKVVARYYQAADLYLHAARAETFPTTVLESLACGTPVVATAVGGIPEQVKGLKFPSYGPGVMDSNTYTSGEATGVLVPPGDARGMARVIEQLLHNDPLRCRLGENAAKDARERFCLERQIDAYLQWYRKLLMDNQRHRGASSDS